MQPASSQTPSPRAVPAWKTAVFKNRGLLLAPAAIALVVFGRPTLASAIVGVLIAAVGEALRIWAVGYSGVTTRANVVVAPALVTAGPYSRVRNPLYVGNAITALGFWVAFSGALSVIESSLLLVLVVACLVMVYGIIIPVEETFLSEQFGAAYTRYREQVPALIPGARRHA